MTIKTDAIVSRYRAKISGFAPLLMARNPNKCHPLKISWTNVSKKCGARLHAPLCRLPSGLLSIDLTFLPSIISISKKMPVVLRCWQIIWYTCYREDADDQHGIGRSLKFDVFQTGKNHPNVNLNSKLRPRIFPYFWKIRFRSVLIFFVFVNIQCTTHRYSSAGCIFQNSTEKHTELISKSTDSSFLTL